MNIITTTYQKANTFLQENVRPNCGRIIETAVKTAVVVGAAVLTSYAIASIPGALALEGDFDCRHIFAAGDVPASVHCPGEPDTLATIPPLTHGLHYVSTKLPMIGSMCIATLTLAGQELLEAAGLRNCMMTSIAPVRDLTFWVLPHHPELFRASFGPEAVAEFQSLQSNGANDTDDSTGYPSYPASGE